MGRPHVCWLISFPFIINVNEPLRACYAKCCCGCAPLPLLLTFHALGASRAGMAASVRPAGPEPTIASVRTRGGIVVLWF